MEKVSNLVDFNRQANWFNIKNYDCINELSEKDVLNQIVIRVHWFKFLESRNKYNTPETSLFFADYERMFKIDWQKITNGNVIVDNQFKQTHPDQHFNDELPALEKSSQEDFIDPSVSPFTINTREFTNTEILDQVEKYLILLRKADGGWHPKKVKFSNYDKTKFKTHKPIAVLDLKIWELLNSKRISQATFERIVFMEDAIDFKQGVLPFIKKLLKLTSRTIPAL